MAKDYARLVEQKSFAKQKTQNKAKWLWVGIGVLVIIGVAFFIYQHFMHKQKLIKHRQQKTLIMSHVSKASKHIKLQKEATLPKFDFYTILQQVPANSPASVAQERIDRREVNSLQKLSASIVNKSQAYFLQLGSFTNKAKANSIKAQLLLLGYSAAISINQQRNVSWYRIVVGPYKQKSAALSAQQHLGKQHFHALLLTK